MKPRVGQKVQVGKDQEKAQSEKDSHSKNRGGKKHLFIHILNKRKNATHYFADAFQNNKSVAHNQSHHHNMSVQ